MGLVKAFDSLPATRILLLFAVISAAVVIESFGDAGRELLRLERARVLDGEWWRLLSGHFTHLAPQHLALNAAGLGLVALLAGRAMTASQWLLAFLMSLVAVNTGLLVFDPQLNWYVGLSGVLHGLLVAGLVAALESRRTESIVLLAVIAAKLAWEQFVGPIPGTSGAAGGAVIVNAHLYGAIGGAVIGAVLISARRRASI